MSLVGRTSRTSWRNPSRSFSRTCSAESSAFTLPRQREALKPRSRKASWNCPSSSTTGCFSTEKILPFDLDRVHRLDLHSLRLAFVVPFPWTSKVTQCERCNSSGADYQLTYEPWQHVGRFALIDSSLSTALPIDARLGTGHRAVLRWLRAYPPGQNKSSGGQPRGGHDRVCNLPVLVVKL